MATAGNHKIIIEKGVDFDIDIQVSENGVVHKDVSGFTVNMAIKYTDDTGAIQTLDTINGSIVPDDKTLPEVDWTYLNGYINVTIDKSATALYPTRVPSTMDAFSTSYEYYYSIDINNVITGEDIRVLRGKCAIREG